MDTYAGGSRTLVLLIITLFWNCKFQHRILNYFTSLSLTMSVPDEGHSKISYLGL
jgi:hypothetical protein